MFSAGSSSTWRDQGRTATQGISHLVRPVAKSQGGDEREICCKSRRHLYLVFDDWKFGYSIRKLCLFPRSCCDQQTALSGQPVLRSLPPPLIRLVAPRCCPKYFVSAFGPRILAMHPRDPGGDSSERYFPMFDVCSLGVTSGPGQEHPINPIYLPVGENLLFTLSTASFEALSFKMLCPAMVGEYCSTDCSMEWSLKELPSQPFKFVDVTSYSLYPDQTLFFSTKMDTTVATFAFDIQALSWKRLGKWAMPFVGRVHFDPQLGAFVGLSEDPGTLGQLCSCGLPSSDTGDGQCPAPVSLLCKEKLFSEEPAERHVSATLIYMGRKSKFSLVECVSIEEDSADQALIEEGDVRLPGRCLYRVTAFFLSHEENGDLKISKDGKVQYCPVPEDTTKWFLSEDPVAFWM